MGELGEVTMVAVGFVPWPTAMICESEFTRPMEPVTVRVTTKVLIVEQLRGRMPVPASPSPKFHGHAIVARSRWPTCAPRTV